jgi:hypothetical protein
MVGGPLIKMYINVISNIGDLIHRYVDQIMVISGSWQS